MTELNGNKHFVLKMTIIKHSIFTQMNIIQVSVPSFDSSVNPLHQVQGLGPVILKVNELAITTSILTSIWSGFIRRVFTK